MDTEKTLNRLGGHKMRSNSDRNAQWGNDRLNVHSLATEILRQYSGPSIMTMAEATTKARRVLALERIAKHTG